MWKQLSTAYKDMLTEKASQGMFVVVQGSKYKVLGQFKDKKQAMDLMKKNPKSKTVQIGKFATEDGKPVDIKVGDEMSYTRFKMATKIKEENLDDLDEYKLNASKSFKRVAGGDKRRKENKVVNEEADCECEDCNCDPCQCGDQSHRQGPEGTGHSTAEAEGLGEGMNPPLSKQVGKSKYISVRKYTDIRGEEAFQLVQLRSQSAATAGDYIIIPASEAKQIAKMLK